ncbi:MAG: hypothetical protein ABIP39_11670, partial [Polyangiaceae bacterium]
MARGTRTSSAITVIITAIARSPAVRHGEPPDFARDGALACLTSRAKTSALTGRSSGRHDSARISSATSGRG